MTLVQLGQAHVCSRCAQRGPTCCEPEEGLSLAPLTPGDIRRIEKHSGFDASQFVAERPCDDEERRALEEDDPVLRGLVGEDGVLRSLQKRGRACVFHRPGEGCTLPYDVRPVLCRRFPVVRDRGHLSVRPGGDCLALDEAKDMPDLLRIMGLREDELARIDRQIRADLRRR